MAREGKGVTMRSITFTISIAMAFSLLMGNATFAEESGESDSKIDVSLPQSLNSQGIQKTLEEGLAEDKYEMVSQSAFAKPVTPEEYFVGVGDRLLLCFWGKKEENVAISVSPEGVIVVPNVGPIKAEGMTLAQLKDRLKAEVKRVLPGINADIFLIEPRRFQIEVIGQVKNPGAYVVTPLQRVSDAIAMAGGIAPWGSERDIKLKTTNKEEIKADLLKYRIFGEPDANPSLREGVISVGFRGRKIKIFGEVLRPYSYELLSDEQLFLVLNEFAAGLTPYASTTEPSQIIRAENGRQIIVTFDVHRAVSSADYASQFALKDSDQIFVPSLVRTQKTATVKGAVFGTGNLSLAQLKSDLNPLPKETSVLIALREGDTLREVIMRAGGLCPWADLKRAYISRQDVQGHKTITIDLFRLFVEKDLSADVAVVSGDVIVVPSIEEKVFVLGEVNEPGAFDYLPSHKPWEYIGLAGGPSERGSIRRTYVLRSEEKFPLKKVLEVEPGDTIIVPEKRLKWWQDYLAITTGIATVLLAGIAAIK